MSGQLISLQQLLSSLSGKQLMSSLFGASSKQLLTERRLEAHMLRTLDRQSVHRVVVHLKHLSLFPLLGDLKIQTISAIEEKGRLNCPVDVSDCYLLNILNFNCWV